MKSLYFILFLSVMFIGAMNFHSPPILEDDFGQTQSIIDFDKKYQESINQIKLLGASDSLAIIIYNKSVKYGFDPLMVTRLIKVESNFNHLAQSNKEAIGLMQITPSTARLYKFNHVTDIETNIDNGLYILRDKQNMYGTLELALLSYNGGHKAVKSRFNQKYANKILGG